MPTDDEPAVRTEDLNYPETLRLTVADADSMFDDALAAAATADAGEQAPSEATRAFQRVSDLRKLLTDRRVEVLGSIHDESPASISELADRLDRQYSVVNEDVRILADYDIVHFREGDRGAKRPYVPYDSIRVDIPLLGEGSERGAADVAP